MGAVLAIPRMICAFPASGLVAFWQHLRPYFFPTKSLKSSLEEQDERTVLEASGAASNCRCFDTMERRKLILDNVMEALADPSIHIIGVYGSNSEIKDGLLPIVRRRIARDNWFDMVLSATISKKPKVKSIQEEMAGQLGFHFNEKSEDKRANELVDRIKNEHKVLVMLYDLHKGLNMGKVGIPIGADHRGCKLLLTSESEEVLSNQMHAQKIFMV